MPTDSTGPLRSPKRNKPPPGKPGGGSASHSTKKATSVSSAGIPSHLRPNPRGNRQRRDFLYPAHGWRGLWVSWRACEGLLRWEGSKDRPPNSKSASGVLGRLAAGQGGWLEIGRAGRVSLNDDVMLRATRQEVKKSGRGDTP